MLDPEPLTSGVFGLSYRRQSIFEALELNSKIHKELKKDLEKLDPKFTGGKGDEGAWAPNIDNDKAIETLEKTIKNCGYDVKKDARLGIDFASSLYYGILKVKYMNTKDMEKHWIPMNN